MGDGDWGCWLGGKIGEIWQQGAAAVGAREECSGKFRWLRIGKTIGFKFWGG